MGGFRLAAYSEVKAQLPSGQHTFHEYRFDPRLQKVKIAHAKRGDHVSGFVLNNRAEAGINGGFWNDVSSNIFALYAHKVVSRWGYSGYIPAPSAIVEIDNQVIADSGAKTPALGWTKDGRLAQIGELVSQWWAELPSQVSFPIARATALNASEPPRYLYLPASAAQALQNRVGLRIKIDGDDKIVGIHKVNHQISPALSTVIALFLGPRRRQARQFS